jgi:carboxypeptidase C (cathepsin A)
MQCLALAFAACAASLVACGGGGGGTPAPAPSPAPIEQPPAGYTDQPYTDPTVYSAAAGASLTQADEGAAVVHRAITIDGTALHYTVTTGHLSAQDASAQPEASFFYVAYTLDGQAAATRPVTFFYNGGPGSASLWLHLGSFGPRRLVTGDPATTEPTPFPLVDNADTLLPTSDLVFVDAVGTGYSEAIAPHTNQSFWGVDADAAAFRDFIERYAAVNGRGASPKFLFGESYGTTRSAVLASLLEAAGVQLKGVVLQSSVLDYNANCGVTGQGACTDYLPTYAAIGSYYQRVTPPQPDLPAFVQQMRDFTQGSYAPALQAYLSNGTLPSGSLISALSSDTGISTTLWQSHFNLDPDTFQTSLIPGTLIGRYDARVSVPSNSPLAAEGDPSSTFISAPFANALASYLVSSLRYTNGSTYTPLSDAIDHWNFSHDGRALPDTVPDLAAAFSLDPGLKLLSVNGYHDLATPFFQTEQDLARLGAGAPVQLRFYSGGHMTYLDDTSRPIERADVQAFYAQALGVSAQAQGARRAAQALPAAGAARPKPPAAQPATSGATTSVAIAASPARTFALRDPWVPAAVRAQALGQPRVPPSQGTALAAQVQRKLQALRAGGGAAPRADR